MTLGGRSARIALFLLQPSASGELHDSSRSCTSLGVRTWIAGPSDDPVLEELHARYTCRGHRFRSRPRWCSRAQSARGPVTGRGPVVGRPAPRRPRAPAPAAASRLTADADRRDRLSVEIARAGPPDRAGWRSCFPGAPPAHAAARAALEPLRPGRICNIRIESLRRRDVLETERVLKRVIYLIREYTRYVRPRPRDRPVAARAEDGTGHRRKAVDTASRLAAVVAYADRGRHNE